MKMFRNAVASLMLLAGMPAAQATTLTNGSFETTILPWVASSGISAAAVGNGLAPDGSYIAIIGFNTSFGSANGALSQSFTLASGGVFDYSFKAGRSEAFCSCQDVALSFSVTIDGTELSSTLPLYDGTAPSFTSVLQLNSLYAGSVALAAGTHEFAFHFSRGESGFGRAPYFGIDGVNLVQQQVSPVPEPSTWAMLLLGFASIGYAAYRQKSRPAATVA